MIIALLMITNKHTQSAPTEKHAIKQGQSDETILIISAEKGQCASMLEKAVYAERANHLLQDTTTYRSSKRDTAKKMNPITKSKFERLRNGGAISKKVVRFDKGFTKLAHLYDPQ